MGKLYFFVSSVANDEVNNLNIFATSTKRAFTLAFKYFARNACRGIPKLLAI